MIEDRRVEIDDGDFCLDASLLGELLDVAPSAIQALMQRNEITSLCERGQAEDEGRYRLTFFYGGRRARLGVDRSGHVLWRSVVDFGNLPLPPAMHRPGGR